MSELVIVMTIAAYFLFASYGVAVFIFLLAAIFVIAAIVNRLGK